MLATLENSDYTVSARLAATLMGAYSATPGDFLHQTKGPRCGILFKERFRASRQTFHFAVAERLAGERPTLTPLRRAIADAPRSCFQFYPCANALRKKYKSKKEKNVKLRGKIFIFGNETDGANAAKGNASGLQYSSGARSKKSRSRSVRSVQAVRRIGRIRSVGARLPRWDPTAM